MRMSISLILGIGAMALGVAACGGSSSNSSTSSSPPATASAAASSPAGSTSGSAASKLSISAAKSGALMFSTTTLSARAGRVSITFTNDSPEGHNFTLATAGGTVVGATPTFSGGAKTLTVHVKAGRYTYYCSVPGHRQAGMQGVLTVS